jgi:signal transduction histidine kinase
LIDKIYAYRACFHLIQACQNEIMILIVDDRPENILPLKKILHLHNYEVDTASSGEEALRKILRNDYSLIILDVQMPGMDGFEVAETITGYSKSEDTPILFLSAVNKEKKFVTQGYRSGGIDYITKPVDPDIFMLKVNTFHRLYIQQQELKKIQESLRNEIESRKKAQQLMAEINETLEHKVDERTRELLEKNAELENRNHELQQFSWVVSHDLIEPLRKIQTFNRIIKEKFIGDNAQATEYFDRTIAASEKMSTLIRDLLDYSRLSAVAEIERTNLHEVMTGLLDDYNERIAELNCKVNLSPLPVVESIKGQMRQVFQNLLSNSLKFCRPGIEPLINIKGEIIGERSFDSPPDENGSFCRITFSDNGIGFDAKFIDRIFVLFQRLNAHSHYEGTGIGLAIVKKIIERHNGMITARSELNNGATFIFVIPLKNNNAYDKENI